MSACKGGLMCRSLTVQGVVGWSCVTRTRTARLPRLRDDNYQVTTVIPAEGVILERILEATYPIWHESLSREAYGKFDAAQMKTACRAVISDDLRW